MNQNFCDFCHAWFMESERNMTQFLQTFKKMTTGDHWCKNADTVHLSDRQTLSALAHYFVRVRRLHAVTQL